MTTAEDVSRVVGVAQEFVTVRWTCGNVSRAWSERLLRSLAVTCGASFNAQATRTDYAARAAKARCPECGGLLTQASDGCAVEGA